MQHQLGNSTLSKIIMFPDQDDWLSDYNIHTGSESMSTEWNDVQHTGWKYPLHAMMKQIMFTVTGKPMRWSEVQMVRSEAICILKILQRHSAWRGPSNQLSDYMWYLYHRESPDGDVQARAMMNCHQNLPHVISTAGSWPAVHGVRNPLWCWSMIPRSLVD